MIEALLEAAREAGCYKVILDCADANAAFYEKCGLIRKEIQMVRPDLSALCVWQLLDVWPFAALVLISCLQHAQVKYF